MSALDNFKFRWVVWFFGFRSTHQGKFLTIEQSVRYNLYIAILVRAYGGIMGEENHTSIKDKIIELIEKIEDESLLEYFLGFMETIKEKWG